MQVHQVVSSKSTSLHSPTRKKIIAFAGLVVVCSLPLALLLFLRAEFISTPLLPVGEAVPRLQLSSLGEGKVVVLGSATGAKQLVLFFTVECSHCQQALVNLENLFGRYKNRLNFTAVSLSNKKKTEDFIHEKAFSFPVALDENKKVKEGYRILGVPALFLIDEQGTLRQRQFGEQSLQADEQLILTFLKESTALNTQ